MTLSLFLFLHYKASLYKKYESPPPGVLVSGRSHLISVFLFLCLLT